MRATTTAMCGILLVLALALAGCQPGGGDRNASTVPAPADFPFDLAAVPLSAELAAAMPAAGGRTDAGAPPRLAETAVRDRLEPAIQRPATRDQAGDELYALLRRDPHNFLWITTAVRYEHLLHRGDVLDSLLARGDPADTNTAVGAFVHALSLPRIGDQGGLLRRAAADSSLDDLNRLVLVRRYAVVESYHGRHLDAVRQLIAALPEVRRVAGDRLEIRYWYSIAAALKWADRLDDAVHALAAGLHLADRTGEAAFAGILRKELASLLAERSEHEAALAQFEKAADFGVRHDLPWVMLNAVDRAAALSSSLGRPDLALAFDRRSLGYSLDLADSLNAPRNMMNLADDFLQLGAVDSARVWLDRARTWVESGSNAENRSGLPWRLAEFHCHVGDFAAADSLLTAAGGGAVVANEEALLLLEVCRRQLEMSRLDVVHRAVGRLRELQPRLFEQDPGQNMAADIALAAAALHTALGEYAQAQGALDEAWLAMAGDGDLARRINWRQAASRLAILRGDLATAQAQTDSSLTLARESGNRAHLAHGRHIMARLLIRDGRHDDALALVSGAGADSAFGGGFRDRLADLALKGRCLRRAGRLDEARRTLERALLLLNPASPNDVAGELHLEHGRVLQEQGDRDGAGASLMLAADRLRRTSPGDRDVLGYLDDSRRDLVHAIADWRLGADPAAAPAADAALVLHAAHDLVLERRTAGAELTVAGLAAAAGTDGSCTAVYFPGDARTLLWVGRQGVWRAVALPGRAELRRLLRPVAADLDTPLRAPDPEALRRLGSVLVAPLEPDWPQGATLYLVADDILANAPWPALQPWPDGQPAVARGPLVRQTRLQPGRGAAAPPQGALLAIGYDGPADDPQRLRAAEAEARAVAGAWTGGRAAVATGPQAAAGTFTDRVLEQADVLHVASHARVREGWQESSVLVLGADAGAPLSAAAIRDLGWNGRLVFLSSCEAGRSHATGRGVLGLAGAFLDGGARNVVASNSRVDDQAGMRFALDFYRHWQDSGSAAEALRAAQLACARSGEDRAHPFHWAHYLLVSR